MISKNSKLDVLKRRFNFASDLMLSILLAPLEAVILAGAGIILLTFEHPYFTPELKKEFIAGVHDLAPRLALWAGPLAIALWS